MSGHLSERYFLHCHSFGWTYFTGLKKRFVTQLQRNWLLILRNIRVLRFMSGIYLYLYLILFPNPSFVSYCLVFIRPLRHLIRVTRRHDLTNQKKNNRNTKFMKSLVRWDIRVLRFMRVHLSGGLTATPDHISTIYIPLFYHQRQGQRQRQRQRQTQRQKKENEKGKDNPKDKDK